MPNTGKPSKDCHECRKRRVKCDLGRPECQRCFKIGKRCPGYRDETSLLFRNEDASSLAGSSTAKDRRRSRTSETSESGLPGAMATNPTTRSNTPDNTSRTFSLENLRAMDALLLSSGRTSPPSRTIMDHWSHFAVPIVLTMFSVEVAGMRLYGLASFLPQMLSSCPEDSPLMMCCQALALAYLANRFHSSEAESIRDEIYGKALAATNVLISNFASAQEDETAVSVWLLSLYEVVVGPHVSTNGPGSVTWNIHVQGLVGLLRMRGPEQLQTIQGRNIFWILSISIQVQSLAAGVDYPDFLEYYVGGLQGQEAAPCIDCVELSKFAKQTAGIAAKIRTRLEASTPYVQAAFLDEIWEDVRSTEVLLNEALYGYTIWQPVDLIHVFLGNQYRAYFIRMLQFVSDLVNSNRIQMDASTDHERLTSMRAQIATEVQSVAAAIMQSVPYILRSGSEIAAAKQSLPDAESTTSRPIIWSDTLRLLWPLRVIAARPALVPQPLLEATQASLHQISTTYCLKQADTTYGGLLELGVH